MVDYNTVKLSDGPRGIRAAVSLLKSGDPVAFPTETVYGLGADACNDRAVAGIFEAKNRPSFNPLIAHVANLEIAETIASFSDSARDLAQAFWPGPLTLVLPRKPDTGLSDLVTAGLDTVAVRIPAHPLAQELLNAFGGPLAAPSANPSGRVSATSADHVLDGLRHRIAAVVDGGQCEVGLESTIVGFDGDISVLLRPGGLPVEAIAACLGQEMQRFKGGDITAPGQMTSHYSPDAGMRINASAPQDDAIWLGFGPDQTGYRGLNLSVSGDMVEAAANLFSHLRELDALAKTEGGKSIAVASIPKTGLGLAINDRLQRAAAPKD